MLNINKKNTAKGGHPDSTNLIQGRQLKCFINSREVFTARNTQSIT